MKFQEMTIDEKLDAFIGLLSCNGEFYYWTYDTEGNLLRTNSRIMFFSKLFSKFGLMDYLLEYIKTSNKLILLSTAQGFFWCADFETDQQGTVKMIHVYGPVATMQLTDRTYLEFINNSLVSKSWAPKLRKYLKQVPVILSSVLMRHAVMFHYCITGERISVADIIFYSSQSSDEQESVPAYDRSQTYRAEQELLRMVREGNLHYKKALEQAVMISSGVGSGEPDPVRNAVISQIVFISLCTRAAIDGGLSPDAAYSKGDTYIKDVLQCTTISDTVQIGHSMYTDFIETVHKRNANPLFSPAVQSCCDYIETHLEEKTDLQTLAKRIGYSEYYLSRKFKKETGMSISEYTRNARIGRAKILLATTKMSIQNISDRLQFGTRSFFTDTFSKTVGIPPAEYRKQNMKL